MQPGLALDPSKRKLSGAIAHALRLGLRLPSRLPGSSASDWAERSGRIALGLLLVAGISACTRTIDDGAYGPLQIGDGKTATLTRLEHHGIDMAGIEPAVSRQIRVESPTRTTIRALDDADGILVWVEGYPFPLRIELDQNIVQRTWPDMTGSGYFSPPHTRITEALRPVQSGLPPGTHRAAVYDAILDLAGRFETTVGNFVVGEDRFDGDPGLRHTDEYWDVLLGSDVWKLEGLEEEVWYPTFYSRVTLKFENGRLRQIRHWAFPFELL